LKEYRQAAKRFARQGHLLEQTVRAPRINRRYRGDWAEALRVAKVLERLVTDERYPLVRRLAHAAKFSTFVAECRLDRMNEQQAKELLAIFEEASLEETVDLFRERKPPSAAAGPMFRQAAAEYVRLHSQYRAQNTWRERWRLARAAVGFARGAGRVPPLCPAGPLSADAQQPLVRFFEANACSLQYVIAARPGWAITEAFRALALSYPIALWLLRWFAHGRSPTMADAIEAVTIIDRGQGFDSLTGGQHRRRVAMLAQDEGLERLIAWYAR
jgi:hypothetical protein